MSDRNALAAAFRSEESFATTLYCASGALFGDTRFLEWDPATRRMEIQAELGVELSRMNANQLNAAITIATSNVFYKDLREGFIPLCNAMFDGRFDPTVWDPADAAEIAWGVTEAMLIWPPPEDEDSPFTDEIVAYIGEVLRAEGMHKPPGMLRLGLLPEGYGWATVGGQFSDDPELFQAIDYVQSAKSDDIDGLVKDRLASLARQLGRLGVEDLARLAGQMIERLERDTASR